MFRAALRYPKSGDGALRRILIGGLLTALSALIVPAIVLGGYYTRVLESATTDRRTSEVPEFDRWWDLLTSGLGFLGVTVVYGLVPAVVVAVGAMTSTAIATLGSAIGLVVYYVLPAALAIYARRGSFGAAFDVGALGDIVLESTYAIGWLQALVLLLVGGAVASALAAVLVGFFLAFYVAVAAFHIYGRAVDAALAEGRELGTSGDVPTA